MWKRLAMLIGVAWGTIGIVTQAYAIDVRNVQTGAVVDQNAARVDASTAGAALEGRPLTITAAAHVERARSLRATATVVNWNITSPGDYMAPVLDLTIQSSDESSLSVSGMGDLTNGGSVIPTFYFGQPVNAPVPAASAFDSAHRAASVNSTNPVGIGVTTLRLWMRLDARTLPASGDYTDTFNLTIGPRL